MAIATGGCVGNKNINDNINTAWFWWFGGFGGLFSNVLL